MRSTSGPFDLGQLSERIEQERLARGLTMSALAREVGVAASTIKRFGSADDAEADGVLAMLVWLGDPPERFVAGSSTAATRLPDPAEGQIRVDMSLVTKALADHNMPISSSARTVTRTTIQRLATTAQLSGQPVASFTRWSEC